MFILDRMLPVMDGRSLLEKIRERGITVPVIMVTALGELHDKVKGFNSGADDYLVKPFDMEELLARVKALLRRPRKMEGKEEISYGMLVMDKTHGLLKEGKNSVSLSKREGALMEFFIMNHEQVLTREQILSRIWGDNFAAASELVRSTIVVSHTKLAETELKSCAALYIEDNGTPLVYCQDLHGESKRTVLFEQLREQALKDGINTGVRPVSLKEVTSKVYKLAGPGKERYWGSVFISAKEDKHRSLLMLRAAWDTEGILQKQRILYLVLNIIGGAVLLFISYGVVRKALKPVEENQKRQREFVASASHELRSPLAVARANAAAITILCKRDFDKSMVIKMEINKFSEGIQSECERMGGLVEDMLLLASADASAWNIKKDIVGMDTLVIELYDSYEVYCRERGMKLSLELGEEILPAILGDRERIRQILSIFIHNAVSYSKEGDCIILRCYEKKHRLILEVEDHGVGISDENKEKVFERFYRNDTARKDKNHFGLGLSIAKELTLQNGGVIKLSDTPGGGCTFAVLFPIADLWP